MRHSMLVAAVAVIGLVVGYFALGVLFGSDGRTPGWAVK